MGGTRIFELGGGAQRWARWRASWGAFNWGKLAADKKRNSALTMQCFDTFRGFLQIIYAATVDGKGKEGTYNFFSRRLGAAGDRTYGTGGGSCPPPHRAVAAHDKAERSYCVLLVFLGHSFAGICQNGCWLWVLVRNFVAMIFLKCLLSFMRKSAKIDLARCTHILNPRIKGI